MIPLNQLKYQMLTFVFWALFSSPLCAQESVAIIGDSFAVGAAAHPNLSLELREMTKVTLGEVSVKPKPDTSLSRFHMDQELKAPHVLWPGIRDYYGNSEWMYAHVMGSVSRTFFTTPEYSWSYMVSRQQNVDAENIWIAADLGARVEGLSRQVDRILDARNKELPSTVFVFFTGQDLCANTIEGITTSQDFGDSLLAGLKYMVRNGTAAKDGTKVYIPHFLPLAELITKESILSYPIKSYGNAKCRELRKNGFQSANVNTEAPVESLYVSAFLPPHFANRCPTLFNLDFLAANKVGFFSQFQTQKREEEIKRNIEDFTSLIATRIRSYRVETDRAIDEMRKWQAKNFPKKAFTFHSIPDTAHIDIEGEDLASDCFHFSLKGQAKIADAILNGRAKIAASAPNSSALKK